MEQDKGNKKKKAAEKYNLKDIDDIWGSLQAEDTDDEEELFEGESLLYGDSYADASTGTEQDFDSDDGQFEDGGDLLYADSSQDFALEDSRPPAARDEQPDIVDLTAEGLADRTEEDELFAEEPAEAAPEEAEFGAVITFTSGQRLEAARARLFHPRDNTIWLVDEGTGDELSIPFAELTCIQLSGAPAGISARQKETSRRETIETIDGRTHLVLVSPVQDIHGLLSCFTMEEQTGFPVILFPKSGITKRTRVRQLTDILLEKRFISRTILQRALQEFELLKDMSFEKIVARRTRIPLAEIKQVLDNAEQNRQLGLQAGEILLISGLVNEEQVLDAIEYHEYLQNLQLSEFLIKRRFVREVEVYAALAEKHRIPFVDLRPRKITGEHLALLPRSMVESHEILPLVRKDDMLLVAIHSVDIMDQGESIARAAGCRQVRYVLSPPSQIRKIIQTVHGKNS
jgi:hypothetical protein